MKEATVAVLGLGRLGSAVASRLAEQGHDVVTWTRSGRSLDNLPAADSPAAASAGRIVVLCLFDGAACRSVLEQVESAQAVVNLSTVAPDEARALAKASGASYVHAPVMGSVSAAAGGTLKILASSPEPVKDLLADLGEVIVCASPDQAAAAKLLANGVLGSSLLTVRQALRQAEALGLPESLTSAVLERTALGGLWQHKRSALTSDSADFTVEALVATLWRSPQLELAPEVDTSSSAIEPLRHYAAGHATGDPAHHLAAFLPSAHVEGMRAGDFHSWTLAEYCALFTGSPASDEAQRRRRVDRLTVTGTVAGATMTLWHGDDVFTDEFVLLQVDGRWWIANKAYHRG